MTIAVPTELSMADLPDWDQQPPGGTLSALTAAIRKKAVSRRTVLKLIAGGAMGIGISALEFIPTRAAAVTPSPVLAVWGDCHGYIDSVSVCVPRTAFYGSTSANPCNGSWHRNDSFRNSGYVAYNFTFNNTSCSGRNAWKWFGASGSGHSTLRRKCSDGYTTYDDIYGNHVNSFSICRTAI